MAGDSTAERLRVVVAGGGAAGFFAAIACAEADPAADVSIHEATLHPLAKVRVSGGGRCNVTHACVDIGEFARCYPRGARELIGPLHRFGPAETVAWFGGRGVETKTEKDGRMFPVTDNSATVVDCLMGEAGKAGVRLLTQSGIRSVDAGPGGRFAVGLFGGESMLADRVLIATGGTKGSAGLSIAEGLGHAVAPPVPSLFTFHVDDPRIRGLEGLSAPAAAASVRGTRLRETGPVLVTHWGLSGPAILKLSAWGARELHDAGYAFTLVVNWAEPRSADQARLELEAEKADHPRRQISSANPFGLPARLWERLVIASGTAADAQWANVGKDALRRLAVQATQSEFAVTGKSMNKEEFVTCGGVRLEEVDMSTMESRIRPGLYFAGEVLDIDGITGGYNFQAAWTTGWHAGRAMARRGAAEATHHS
jgi:predicted Rossmann fold flavoprotein